MWYLKHISATDICSFRTLDYAPAEGTTTLIFGHNADNESQRSNGAGKSTPTTLMLTTFSGPVSNPKAMLVPPATICIEKTVSLCVILYLVL